MNIPNILTSIRFLLVPVFIIVFYSTWESSVLYATYIFILAGITDILDGYIARTYNMVTKWGTALDPLADKLMQLTVLICFTQAGYIPIWVIVVVGLKELVMISGGLFLYYGAEKTVIPANKYGKVSTIVFYIAILVVAFKINQILSYIVISLAVGFTLLAFINYLLSFKKVRVVNTNK